MRLVLASGSPRRKELLAQAGFGFEVRVAGVDETRREGEAPTEYVRRLAVEKAQAVLASLSSAPTSQNRDVGHPAHPAVLAALESAPTSQNRDMGHLAEKRIPLGNDNQSAQEKAAGPRAVVVLGADTTVVLDGAVMNKPRDREDAERMLRALSGRTHQVHTGVAVVCSECVLRHVETTEVRFREIGEEEMRVYLDSGDPLDKAGAYGIQGYAARWIPQIEGDYFNVVGLPVAAVVGLLRQCVSAGPAESSNAKDAKLR